jgi:hypothetical protein
MTCKQMIEAMAAKAPVGRPRMPRSTAPSCERSTRRATTPGS